MQHKVGKAIEVPVFAILDQDNQMRSDKAYRCRVDAHEEIMNWPDNRDVLRIVPAILTIPEER